MRRARTELGVDGPVVASLGALTEEKRPLDAVHALGYLPGATLVVAGRGPMHDQMLDLAEAVAPGRVLLIGESSDPAAILAAADVVVLPSRTEGMPGVIIEAKLRGVPVVATSVGAVPSMIVDGVDGFVVAPGDAVGLAARSPSCWPSPIAFNPWHPRRTTRPRSCVGRVCSPGSPRRDLAVDVGQSGGGAGRVESSPSVAAPRASCARKRSSRIVSLSASARAAGSPGATRRPVPGPMVSTTPPTTSRPGQPQRERFHQRDGRPS